MLLKLTFQSSTNITGGLICSDGTPGTLLSQLGKTLRNPLQECGSLSFDSVLLVPETALQALLNRKPQPEGEIGLQPRGGDLFEPLNQVPIQTTAIALIGEGRSRETIADHPITTLQSRTDQRFNMLSPIGGIQQQFSGGSWCLLVSRVQQEFTDRAPQGSASRLTGAEQGSALRHQTAVGQPLDQMLDLHP